MKKLIIGIDVSAKTLDICIKKNNHCDLSVIKNKLTAIKRLFKSIDQEEAQVVVAMENTGEYNNYLYQILCNYEHFDVYVVSPIHIHRSLGLVRGKSDKIDAERIAKFIEKNQDELTPWVADSQDISELKTLLTERNYLVKRVRGLRQKIKSLKTHKKSKHSNKLVKLYNGQIKIMLRDIKELEKLMEIIIQENTELNELSKLARSVPGIGKVCTWFLLCKTNGFKQYTDPRKLACCIGIVPFNYTSGTSIKSKNRLSKMADKKFKTIIHMAAMRAVRMNNDIQIFYEHKVAQGKNKMNALNAVRNKLIKIVLAVVKNKNLYQNRLVMS